jgi:virginiamycin B lyase
MKMPRVACTLFAALLISLTIAFSAFVPLVWAKSHTITEFQIPTSNSSPESITSGPDGNLWFTEWGVNKVGRVTPSGTFTEFPIPTPNSFPTAITSGPDGNLWFTEGQGNKIGRITLR